MQRTIQRASQRAFCIRFIPSTYCKPISRPVLNATLHTTRKMNAAEAPKAAETDIQGAEAASEMGVTPTSLGKTLQEKLGATHTAIEDMSGMHCVGDGAMSRHDHRSGHAARPGRLTDSPQAAADRRSRRSSCRHSSRRRARWRGIGWSTRR